jgi:hypothetical protein
MIWKIWKKGKLNSEKIWKKSRLKREMIWKIWRKGNFSRFNLLFFHIFHIIRQFDLLSSAFSISFRYSKSRLKREMIWKIWRKGNSNNEKIWKI